jgi:hypothetical protein
MAKKNNNPIQGSIPKSGMASLDSALPPTATAISIANKKADTTKGVISFPSRIVYSVDVPEIRNLSVDFIYNYYTPDETVNGIDTLNNEALRKRMNISTNIQFKRDYNYTDDTWLTLDNTSKLKLEKIPRYVKIQFTLPQSEKAPFASGAPNLISSNNESILKEETFSSNYFTSLYFNNADLDKKTSVFSEGSDGYKKQIDSVGEADAVIADTLASQPSITKGALFFKSGQGVIKGNSYLESLKKLSSSTQISNNVIHDLIVNASGNPLTLNEKTFKSMLSGSAVLQENVTDINITEQEFKTSLQYYEIISTEDNSAQNQAKYEVVGYIIDKTEIFPDGSRKNHPSIILENPRTNSTIDLDVRYGSVYAYSVRTVMSMTYAAVNNLTYETAMIKSLIASKPTVAYAETLENVGPPPPVELKATWDYDRVNPTTAVYDPVTSGLYANTGKNGSLLLHWSFPVNSQMDIKKFQVFRRKNIEEPFELIKVFDFNDAVFRFPDLDDKINPRLIEFTLPNPKKHYYDDEFYKNSEYIYAVAAIDAHGLTSNYSEQIKVTFDSYKNKLITEVLSAAGAPKQYPNLYLQEDLFIDTIKTSNKKTLNVYFTPDCKSVFDSKVNLTNIVKLANDSKYTVNFINLDNQDSAKLDITISNSTITNG